ncbi:peroxide stress protein YaaA, partial [Aquiluna sp.]|nr:peroxide stress protein YaaA [Aquiluna sp.]
ETKTTYFVEVLEAGSGRALNHFNKKAKGAFARSILENGMEQIGDAEAVAAKAGLAVRLDGKRLELLVPKGF